eukprot:2709460-Alexandrium_andersonii.AAC.1
MGTRPGPPILRAPRAQLCVTCRRRGGWAAPALSARRVPQRSPVALLGMRPRRSGLANPSREPPD